MSTVLVVHHAPSPRMQRILEAIRSGLAQPELAAVAVVEVPALAATADQVLRSDAMVLLSPANFGYMSGALKHFFDTTFYTCLGAVAGRPYAACVHGDDDTTGAVRAIESIAVAWGLEQVAATLALAGDPDQGDRAAAAELAATVAAHLAV